MIPHMRERACERWALRPETGLLLTTWLCSSLVSAFVWSGGYAKYSRCSLFHRSLMTYSHKRSKSYTGQNKNTNTLKICLLTTVEKYLNGIQAQIKWLCGSCRVFNGSDPQWWPQHPSVLHSWIQEWLSLQKNALADFDITPLLWQPCSY